VPTPNNPITQGSYWVVTPAAEYVSKAYGNLNGSDLFFYVAQGTNELRVVGFSVDVPGNTTYVLALDVKWVGVVSAAGIVHVYYADLNGQMWYIPFTLIGASVSSHLLSITNVMTFSVTYTPQSNPSAFMIMIDDGVHHTLYVSGDPLFGSLISTMETYSNALDLSNYITMPSIAMHPLDTNVLTVICQKVTEPPTSTYVGFYAVTVQGLS